MTAPVDLASRYDVIEELGRGGSAVVYRARERAGGREVAIKVAYPARPSDPLEVARPGAEQGARDERDQRAADEPIQRLINEARVVTKLQHPNVVAVHAVHRLQDGGVALVMDLVRGRTLRTVLREHGPLPPNDVAVIMRDVARALAAAHAQGVVHRDVKPENVFLDETEGRALLSDFGIARAEDADVRLTQTGIALGTPAYMSPEQIDAGAVDGRADLYSLGTVAWELLTGQRPWEGLGLYAVLSKQKSERLAPIDVARPADCEPAPLELQYTIERMIEKHPSRRFASADALLKYFENSDPPPDFAAWVLDNSRRVAVHRRALTEPVVDTGTDTMRVNLADLAAAAYPEQNAAATKGVPRTPRRALLASVAMAVVAAAAFVAVNVAAPGEDAAPPADSTEVAGDSADTASAAADPTPATRDGRYSAASEGALAIEPRKGARKDSSAAAAPGAPGAPGAIVAAAPDGAPTTPAPSAVARIRDRLLSLIGRRAAVGGVAGPDLASVVPPVDTVRSPNPAAVHGTWYFGDRRSTLGDSLRLELRSDATASLIERRFWLGERGRWRSKTVPREGRWEVRYGVFPARSAELCVVWRTPEELTSCGPYVVDTLPDDRLLDFGGRYWRSTQAPKTAAAGAKDSKEKDL